MMGGNAPRLDALLITLKGQAEAAQEIDAAKRQAEAKAMYLFAATQCPADLIEWGKAHGIPTFAEMTWQAGFRAGMRAAVAALPKEGE